MSKIIAGFPGIGKSYIHNKVNATDSDSSKFSWKMVNNEKVRNENFVEDYYNHILELLNSKKYDYIFISTHEAILEKLRDNNIEFTIVIPHEKRKEEFKEIYEKRTNFPTDIVINNWDKWLKDILVNKNVAILDKGLFLEHYLRQLDRERIRK